MTLKYVMWAGLPSWIHNSFIHLITWNSFLMSENQHSQNKSTNLLSKCPLSSNCATQWAMLLFLQYSIPKARCYSQFLSFLHISYLIHWHILLVLLSKYNCFPIPTITSSVHTTTIFETTAGPSDQLLAFAHLPLHLQSPPTHCRFSFLHVNYIITHLIPSNSFP